MATKRTQPPPMATCDFLQRPIEAQNYTFAKNDLLILFDRISKNQVNLMNEISLIKTALVEAIEKVSWLESLAEAEGNEFTLKDRMAARNLLDDLHPLLIDCADNTFTLGQKLGAQDW
ncbi:hypothetical protein N8146_09495 [Ascidiaceihabitans sp.]|nr:hypothetical protein [Ascidiaceihabitans sp.]